MVAEAFFGGGSSSDSRLHRFFPSLANLRSKSRSPNGSERDNASDVGVSPGPGTAPRSPIFQDEEFRPQANTLSPPTENHFSAKSSEFLIDLSTPSPSTVPPSAYGGDLGDIELDQDERELNRAINESLAASSMFSDRAAGPGGRLAPRSFFERQHARNASVNSTNRYTAGGTDLIELERALALSLLEGGYQPNYIDDTGDDATPEGDGRSPGIGGEESSSGGARLDPEGPERCWYFPP